MKKIIKPLFSLIAIVLIFSQSGCLKSELEELKNSNLKVMFTVDYTYRFLYNDTVQKGTPKQEILIGRVCEVILKKQTVAIKENGMDGFSTTVSYDANSVLKAGPTGSVTKTMLYTEFQKLIQADQLNKLWVYVTVSDVATVIPMDNSPALGSPGDFSKDRVYRVKASDGSTKDYLIRTVKGF
ncbi:hypothetical protein [Pedobacter sp. V48]|uniref:DUF5018-related domain-containing protein n=1 Tax=Pedobacter sp. V48 TaxID=509635 RepID=UPI0003E51DAA|nr:hypothetical protein [Pedobacter sp. V48]ETZ22070.1 hypothetical protein N824_24410 [Pedobacter sp. V48]